MAGLQAHTPMPTALTLHGQTRRLEIVFDDGAHFFIPFELMRVFSPSAEVKGHGPGQETVQTGKRAVSIVEVVSVGHYAIQPTFSDGHDSGIYSWDLLYEMGAKQAELWRAYDAQLQAAGVDRDDPMPTPKAQGGSCASAH